jgi:hypothetical protein
MRWRAVIGLAVVGIGLMLWGGMEWHLGRGASSKPERITLKQLIARGPDGNPNIILTDFELGDNFVYEEKDGRWTGVYVPAFPAGEPKAAGGPGQPPAAIKAVIFSLHVHSQAEVDSVLAKRELPALVTNRIRSLGSEEERLLQNHYGGGIDTKKCLLIQEGRTPMSGAVLALIFGGGLLCLLGAVGIVVGSIVADYKRTGPKRKGRREDEDDEPRPRRRRPRDEDEP